MVSIARFVLKGLNQASLIAAATAILGLLLLPAAWLSGAVIGLVTLVNGVRQGLIVTGAATVGAGLFSWILFNNPQVTIFFTLLIWLPVWTAASILQRTVSLALSLQTVTVFCLLGVLYWYVAYPDYADYWQEPISVWLDQFRVLLKGAVSLDEIDLYETLIVRLLPGLLMLNILISIMLSLFLARWWQAVIYNPGGFKKEFYSLDLGKVSAVVMMILIGVELLMPSDVTKSLLLVALILYLKQGIAIMHVVVAQRKLNDGWLYITYVLMFFIPKVLIVVALSGVIDPWVNIRKRTKVGS